MRDLLSFDMPVPRACPVAEAAIMRRYQSLVTPTKWDEGQAMGKLGASFWGQGDLNLGVHFVDCQAETDNEKEALLPQGWGMRDEKCTVHNA